MDAWKEFVGRHFSSFPSRQALVRSLRSDIDRVLAVALLLFILFVGWRFFTTRGIKGGPLSNKLAASNAPIGALSFSDAYKAGLDHMKKKEYGQAVQELEDAVVLDKKSVSARQELALAQSLAELDFMKKKGLISKKVADLMTPTVRKTPERKRFQLESISFRKATEGAPVGSKIVLHGTVVSGGADGFTVENKALDEVFVVRGAAATEGMPVTVYGELIGVEKLSSSLFPEPILSAKIVDRG